MGGAILGAMRVTGAAGGYLTGDGVGPYVPLPTTPHANLQAALDTVLAELQDLRQRMAKLEEPAPDPEPARKPIPANALRHTPGW